MKGVDVESRVGLVEDRQFRVEHRHLENLVFSSSHRPEKPSFTARDVSFASSSTTGALLAHQAQELGGRQQPLAAELALFVHGQLHEIGHRDARDLDRVLEAEEQAQRARSSIGMTSRSCPRNVAEPSVTVNFHCPRAPPRASTCPNR